MFREKLIKLRFREKLIMLRVRSNATALT